MKHRVSAPPSKGGVDGLAPRSLFYTSDIVGSEFRIEAEVRGSGGRLIANAPIRYESPEPEVATVDSTGLVEVVGYGDADCSTDNPSPRPWMVEEAYAQYFPAQSLITGAGFFTSPARRWHFDRRKCSVGSWLDAAGRVVALVCGQSATWEDEQIAAYLRNNSTIPADGSIRIVDYQGCPSRKGYLMG